MERLLRGSGSTTRGALSALAATVAAVATLLLPATAFAIEMRTGDSVVVAPGETVDDDLYAFANSVVIQGTVNGDVVAGGADVSISGSVDGAVMAAGNSVTISGPVGGSVRAAGNVVTIASAVQADVLAAGNTVTVAANGSVGRDVLAAGSTVSVLGPVDRDVSAYAERVVLNAPVSGNVHAEASDVALESGAQVEGSLTYVSPRDATMAPGASVSGTVARTAPTEQAPNPAAAAGLDVVGWIRNLVGLAALGVLFALVFPTALVAARDTLARRWAASLGWGSLAFFGLPFLAIFLFVVGLLVGGWWIGLLLLPAYLLLLVLGYLLSATWVGDALLTRAGRATRPIWSLLLGLLLLGLVTIIPFVGWLVGLVAVVVGLGGLILAASHGYAHIPREPTDEGAPLRPAPA